MTRKVRAFRPIVIKFSLSSFDNSFTCDSGVNVGAMQCWGTNRLLPIPCILSFWARITGYTGSGPLKGPVAMRLDLAGPMILSSLGPHK
jgi:hypothetical protein